MIYRDDELIEKVKELLAGTENEVVEFKEAKSTYSFKKIGEYFSALSNEANIRGFSEAWLIFGVKDNREICGSEFRKNGGLQSIKKEVADDTNNRLTFIEVYEVDLDNNRIVAFQIPSAIPGIPTTWHGASYSREGESLAPLSIDKLDFIRSQIGRDWSKEIVDDATIDDLDPDAVAYARHMFAKKQGDHKSKHDILESLTDIEVLNKAGICFKGKITRTALLLLGNKESAYYFDGFTPRITWTLYNADMTVKAYEHFDMPFLLAIDKVYAKIRNEKYRYIAQQETLFPEEVDQYNPDLIKEIINNCIAHSDYRLRGKINVEEFEDHLTFINEGSFIPERIETALEPGYKPPYYRNAFLCSAMVNLYMIDTNSMGIPMIYKIQKDKGFPLPSYDLETPNRVKVTVFGKILDTNYTKLLFANADLDLQTVFLLDKIQKGQTIRKEDFSRLKSKKLVEGRYPNIYVSYKVAEATGKKAEYIKNKGLDEEVYNQLIIKALDIGPARKAILFDVIKDALPNNLNDKQKSKKLSYMLQKLKNNGIINVRGIAVNSEWYLINKTNKNN